MTSLPKIVRENILSLLLVGCVNAPALAQNPPPSQPPLTSQDLPPPMQGDIIPPQQAQAAARPQAQQQPQQASQQQPANAPTQGAYGASTYLRIGGQVVRFQLNTGLAADQKQKLQQLLGQSCFVDERAPASATPPCGLPIVWPKDQGEGLAIYCDSGRDDCLSGSEAPRLRIAPAEPSRPTIAGNVSAYAVQTRGSAKKSQRPRVYQADVDPAAAATAPDAP